MSLRCVHAVQASFLCALVALAVSYPILTVTKLVEDLQLGTLVPGCATAVVALVIWYLAFPDASASPKRGVWVGPLIVFLAMWMMFTVFGLFNNATYLGNEGIMAIVVKTVFVSLFFTLYGNLFLGILLFPLSMVIAVKFRKWQL